MNRGRARGAKGEYNLAIADHNEAIRLNPTFALAYHDRSNARLAKGEYDQAIADLNEAIRLDPNRALAYLNITPASKIGVGSGASRWPFGLVSCASFLPG